MPMIDNMKCVIIWSCIKCPFQSGTIHLSFNKKRVNKTEDNNVQQT